MTEIMKIEDSFLLLNVGLVVSGINPLLDHLSSEAIKVKIGKRVRIALKNGGNIDCEVRDVAVSNSLVGKKNISVVLDTNNTSSINQGSCLLAIEE